MLIPTNSVMVDLETLSLETNAAILTIGAVCFNGDGISKRIHLNVDPKSCQDAGLHVDADTVMWWLEQSAVARQALTSISSRSLSNALLEFSGWLPDNPKIWGNGAMADNQWLISAYKAVGWSLPWGYRDNMCYRTMRALLPTVKAPNVGTVHNAVDDAEYQALYLIKALAKYKENQQC